jgi:hypothetical protein
MERISDNVSDWSAHFVEFAATADLLPNSQYPGFRHDEKHQFHVNLSQVAARLVWGEPCPEFVLKDYFGLATGFTKSYIGYTVFPRFPRNRQKTSRRVLEANPSEKCPNCFLNWKFVDEVGDHVTSHVLALAVVPISDIGEEPSPAHFEMLPFRL